MRGIQDRLARRLVRHGREAGVMIFGIIEEMQAIVSGKVDQWDWNEVETELERSKKKIGMMMELVKNARVELDAGDVAEGGK